MPPSASAWAWPPPGKGVGKARRCVPDAGSVSVHVGGGGPPSPFPAELSEEWMPARRPRRPALSRGAPPLSLTAPGLTAAVAGAGPGGLGGATRWRPPSGARRWRPGPAGRGSGGCPRGEPVPPELVERARALDALARKAPSTMAARADVSGIGPDKLEPYGDELLALLAAARPSGPSR